jgi:2-methylisocitrate lyase-like PEP mutase family enzyme
VSKTDTLRELHRGPALLVLPNAWDVESARRFAALPGCRAIATTSGGVSRSLGWEDGERIPLEEMLRVVERIAAAVDVPVTADLEAGYGDPAATAAAALAAGAAGMNLEDSRQGVLLPLDEQVFLLREVRRAAPELVVNGRVDVFIHGGGDVAEAVERANAYLAAGADCAYPIFAPDELVEELCRGIDGPVNVLARLGESLERYARAGVRRVTFGSRFANAGLDEAERLARDTLR